MLPERQPPEPTQTALGIRDQMLKHLLRSHCHSNHHIPLDSITIANCSLHSDQKFPWSFSVSTLLKSPQTLLRLKTMLIVIACKIKRQITQFSHTVAQNIFPFQKEGMGAW